MNRTDAWAALNLQEDVELTLTTFAAGDTVLRTRPNPRNFDGTDDYSLPSTVMIDKSTGTGTFTFSVLNDTIPEAREVVRIDLTDPDGNMPRHWRLKDNNPYRVIINPNDNAIRFAEWERHNPGGFAGLDMTMREGERRNLVVLMTNYAYHEPLRNNREDYYRFYVRSDTANFRDELSFFGGNTAESRWDNQNGILQVRTRPAKTVVFDRGGVARPGGAPVTTAYLAVIARQDNIREVDETIELHLEHQREMPPYWGSITNLPDTGSPPVMTSTTVRITILGDASLGFAEGTSEATEGGTPAAVTLNISPPLDQSASVKLIPTGTAAEGVDYTIQSEHYNPDTDTLTLPANTASLDITVTPVDDSNPDDGKTIILTISDTDDNFPDSHTIETGVHTVTIRDDDGVSIGFAESSSKFFEGVGDFHIELVASGITVPPAGVGVPMMITGSPPSELAEVGYDLDTLKQLVDDGDDLLLLPGANAGDNPRFTFRLPSDGTPEPGGTITFTMADKVSLALPDGSTKAVPSEAAARTHVLTIEPSNASASFSPASSSVAENAVSTTIRVSLNLPAPSDGLPLQITINGNADNLVTFDPAEERDNVHTFTVDAGKKSHDVTVHINDNPDDEDNEPITLTLSAGAGFPTGWGQVTPGFDTYTLTVTDDDEVSTSPQPDPSPPRRETSPTRSPESGFQRDALSNPR